MKKRLRKKKRKTRVGYMCAIDFQWELGEVYMEGIPVYRSVEELKKLRTCWEECGILKVTVKARKWVEKQDFFKKT